METASSTPSTSLDPLVQSLRQGFEKIRHRLETRKGGLLIDRDEYIRVRFVDSTLQKNSLIKAENTTQGGDSAPSSTKSIYESILEQQREEENHTYFRLKQVSYQHFRTGHQGTTDGIAIQPQLYDLHNHDDEADNIACNPTHWHALPYTYVYFCSCQTNETYRTKVKPAIQAFIRQIISNYDKKDIPTTVPSPTFLIAYVPSADLGDDATNGSASANSSASQHTSSASRMGAALASRMAMARQRIAGQRESSNATDSSTHGGHNSSSNNNASSDNLTSAEFNESSEEAIMTKHLSKQEREILKRLVADFDSHVVVTIPKINDESPKYELAPFLKGLGDAVAEHFQNRCKLFDEEIRRLDALRAAESAQRIKKDTNNNILTLFFLVKEGLSITYQQMRLMSEALIQYNELRAVVPDIKTDATTIVKGLVKDLEGDPDRERLMEAAASGQVDEFRRLLEKEHSFAQIPETIETYLLEREVSLLLAIGNPVEVMKKCLQYVSSVHWYKMEKAKRSKNSRRKALIEAEEWGFQFCWDVKDATTYYYSEDSLIEKGKNGPHTPSKGSRVVNITFARLICDILELARLRFLKIGTYRLEGDELVASLSKQHFRDMSQKWSPYVERNGDKNESTPSISKSIALLDSEQPPSSGAEFLANAFDSSANFQARYLQILDIAACYNRHGERNRSAGRLSTDLVEIYVREGDNVRAAAALQAVADDYGSDQWRACQFLLLFRLAGLQRQFQPSSDYLDVLVSSFGSHFVGLAPKLAQKHLFDDLVQVTKSSSTDGKSYADASLFSVSLPLEPPKEYSPVRGERGLVKRLVSVGQKVEVKLLLENHLPSDIRLDSVEVSLVPFQAYVASNEDGVPVLQNDVVKNLKLKGGLECPPGKTSFILDWVPLSPGQFVIAFSSVFWNNIEFLYTTKQMKPFLIRMDVLPSESTQTLTVEPAFLLPGQIQPVTIKYSAGSDIVREALLATSGESDVEIALRMDAEVWNSSLDIEIPGMDPGQTYETTVFVKTGRSESQFFLAELKSSYRFQTTELADEVKDDAFTETVLEEKIPSLGESAVVVEGSSFTVFAPGKGIMNLSMSSTTPAKLTLRKACVKLPSFLKVHDEEVAERQVNGVQLGEGDRVLVAFECDIVGSPIPKQMTESSILLRVDFEDDHRTSFHEELDFDLIFESPLVLPCPTMTTASVSISSSCSEGMVGKPLTLKYACSGLSALPCSQILYNIQVISDGCWMISGKSRGKLLVSNDRISVEMIATPLCPGRHGVDSFPRLSLFTLDEENGSKEIEVTVVRTTSLFEAKSLSHYKSVACNGERFEL